MHAGMSATPRIHLAELTSARFLAAMAVFLSHMHAFGLPQLFVPFTGGFGVDFFFVLSGFILCYVYRDAFAEGIERAVLRRFLVARFARVYPCYALALVLLTALFLALGNTLPENPVTSWMVNLLALQTFAPSYETQQHWNAPSWSISTEFAFYALCPLLLAAIARWARDRTTLVGLTLFAIAFSVIVQTLVLIAVFNLGFDGAYWLDLVANRNIVFRLPEFAMGVLAASLLYGGHLGFLQERARARNALLLLGVIAVLAINITPWPPTDTGMRIVRQYRWDVAYMIPFTAIIVALAAGPTVASRLLRRPSFVFLGEISYAIYIYHWIAWTSLAALVNRGQDPKPWLLPAIVLVVLFSAASYLWFEKPARRWIRERLAG
jgi:peptidoglycan/LPS O-acetylase OafA/YrhL